MSAETRKSDTHEERYAHIEIEGHPRVYMATVFGRREKGQDGPPAWETAVAYCAHGDQFNRRIGRQVARRKFFQGDRWQRTLLMSDFKYETARIMALGGLTG